MGEPTFLAAMAIGAATLIGLGSLGVTAGALEAWATIPTRRHKVRVAEREYDRALTRHAEEMLRGDA